MSKQDTKSRQKIRRRKQSKAGSVMRILTGPELTTSPCEVAWKQHLPIVKDMIATLLATDNGVGLAAPQIGHNVRIFIMRDPLLPRPLVFVNPVLVARSIEMATDQEGCLSEPGKYVPVERHIAVWVKWYDEDCKTRYESFLSMSARIIQHEMDHLDGFCEVLTTSPKK